jgi:glutathione peroxidase
MTKLGDFSATRIGGGDEPLSDFDGKVVLVVNVASQCGKTPQYAGLEALYRTYKDRGLEILGFPCNQFEGQEPGTDDEIARFCELNYGVTFPLFTKIEVNGPGTHPLYRWLKAEAHDPVKGGEEIGWNFTKFLVGRDGKVVSRYVSDFQPEGLAGPIEAQL